MELPILEGIGSKPLDECFTHLSRMPPKIVHQVLSNLEIVHALQILTLYHGYLNSCILTSLEFQGLSIPCSPTFDSAQGMLDLMVTVKLFLIYHDFRTFENKVPRRKTSRWCSLTRLNLRWDSNRDPMAHAEFAIYIAPRNQVCYRTGSLLDTNYPSKRH
jgi:hypothetical protein